MYLIIHLNPPPIYTEPPAANARKKTKDKNDENGVFSVKGR